MGLNCSGFRGSDPSPTCSHGERASKFLMTCQVWIIVIKINYVTGMPELVGEARIRHASSLRRILPRCIPVMKAVSSLLSNDIGYEHR
jgi:hypothetical protein